ncbi:hypothetical protein Daesc_003213 [Daldinia eschscholtzii]|uniref:Cation/H+ exchanger transmembrane domain-containing protein n=1 Tax=Daldinia eschscholtzii TaxID=292717 RepID=A0AAX6MT18_9PEZI
MPTLAPTNFNIVVSVLGGWISVFGLVSYLLKENFYLSEALISLLAGLVFSPHAANFVRPLEYAGSEENLNAITLYFTRLVLGVQLVLAGVQLPSRYLKKEWKPLALLLGPIMTAMWIITSLLVWALVPNLPFLHALAIGACVTPTDPVLSNVIVKGRFADHNVPKGLQKIIIAESGANDGLGYPFLFLALYLVKYIGDGGVNEKGGAGLAIGLWFGETWGYTILLSVIYGAVVGWIAKELLHFCEEHKFVDRESFLVFAFSLALFITGTCGMIGSDDILACFIAGNVFTWDDWFRLETLDEYASLQPTIDMLLNVTIFMWYGAVCPVVHGLSIPLGKFGFYLPRTISRSLTSAEDVPFQIGARIVPQSRSRDVTATHTPTDSRSVSARPVFRVGGSIITEQTENTTEAVGAGNSQDDLEASPKPVELGSFPNVASPTLHSRTIRFPDESSSTGKNSQEPNRDATAGS